MREAEDHIYILHTGGQSWDCGLTFDPVALVQVDLSFGLCGVRTDHHKMSAGDGAVQLPPGAYCLAVTAGTEGEEGNS